MKHTYEVSDMSCGHCKMRIENAFKAWGKADSCTVDLNAKKVVVESAENAEVVARVIEDVGYTPKQA